MSKKIITYVLTLAMIFSVFCNPALGYAEAETESSATVQNEVTEELPSDITDTEITEEDNTDATDPSEDESKVEEKPVIEKPEKKPEVEKPKVGTVKGLKAKALSHNKIKLTWKAVPKATDYQIYRYSKKSGKYVYLKTVKSTKTEIGKLTKSTKYYYKVRARIKNKNGIYYGEKSSSASCRTNPYLTKPTKLKGSALSCKEVKISWQKVSGAKGYKVYRYSKTKGKYVLVKTTSKNYFRNTDLKADTKYYYKVKAYKIQDGKTFYGPLTSKIGVRTEKTDRDKIISLAYSKRDCQYKWGAKGPKKFDCSGYVYWVFNNADVKLKKKVPKTSAAGQYSALKKYMIGKSIKSINKAKPGDIIFYKYGGRISHVGIYYGDGKMIHAANARKDIRFDKVKDYERWGFKVVGIARVLN